MVNHAEKIDINHLSSKQMETINASLGSPFVMKRVRLYKTQEKQQQIPLVVVIIQMVMVL